MVTAADFMRTNIKRLQDGLEKVMADLTPDQLHTVPAGHPKANTIAWGVWHYTRTEDNIVRYVIQGRKPPIWVEGGYGERLGPHPAAPPGTGMSTEGAQAPPDKGGPPLRAQLGKVWGGAAEPIAG